MPAGIGVSPLEFEWPPSRPRRSPVCVFSYSEYVGYSKWFALFSEDTVRNVNKRDLSRFLGLRQSHTTEKLF